MNTTNPTNAHNKISLKHPTVMRWRNWHFGKVKDVSDNDILDFVKCEHKLRAAIPSASLDYVMNTHNLFAKANRCLSLPRSMAIRTEIISSLASQYNVNPDLVLIRLREILKCNKKSPRYDEVARLYYKQKSQQIRDLT